MEYKITQSFIKDLLAYSRRKECGLVVKAKYIDNRWNLFTTDTDSQNIGKWVEFMCTGALPKNGIKPEPEFDKKGEMKSAYAKMLPHIKRFKDTLTFYGLKIIEKNFTITEDDLKGTYDMICEATRDIYVTYDGNQILLVKKGEWIIIDLKTSGLIDNKWDEMGWHLDTLAKKEKLIIQPIHYVYLGLKKYGVKMPFWFFLLDNTDSANSKIINFIIDEAEIEIYEENLIGYRKKINACIKNGWKTHPSSKRCTGCPLKSECPEPSSQNNIPVIENFYFSSANK